ncbi:MAG: TonB-dependent receptor [Caulobacteraceae bacterium]
MRLYGYFNYAYRKSGSYVNGERVVASTIDPLTLQTLTITPSTRADTALFPNGYDPRSKSDSADLAAVGGVTFGNQDHGKLDLSVSYGSNEAGKWTLGTTNPSWGAASPTNFYWGSTKSNQTTAQADYARNIDVGVLAKPIVFSAGLVYRHEYWGTGDLADVDAYTNGGLANAQNKIPIVAASVDSPIRPQDAGSFKRDVEGGYAGLEANLTSHLNVGITGRYEHYSDFGGTANGDITARYEFTPAVALRGTVSTGFHAPALAMLGTQITGYTATWSNTGIAVGTPGQTRLFRPNDPQGAAFGDQPLKPEKSQDQRPSAWCCGPRPSRP